MNIVGRDIRQLIIDHVGKFGNVETPCRNVGCDKDLDPVFLKVLQCASPGGLAFIAMNDTNLKTIAFELLCQTIGAMFGSGKDQGLPPESCRNQMNQQGLFMILLDDVGLLLDALCRGIARGHFNALRILEKRSGKIPNVL